jgi:ubiquinone/menaquinone biosynthesis C-methylase UbiE
MGSTLDPDAFREFERQGHDRLADSYARLFTSITGLAVDHLLDAAGVRAGTRVLDVACGPGLVCAAARARGGDAIGVDLSPRMVEIARKLVPGGAFRVEDVERLAFPDASFDAVVCNFGLGHFPRPEASVANCIRLVIPGGRAAFAWWDTLEKQRLQAVFREAMSEAGVKPSARIPAGHDMFRFSATGAFRQLLEASALEQVEIQDFGSSIDVAGAAELWQIGMGSLAVTSSIILDADDNARAAILRAFERIAESYRRGAALRIPIAFKIGSGRKPDGPAA